MNSTERRDPAFGGKKKLCRRNPPRTNMLWGLHHLFDEGQTLNTEFALT